MIDGNFTRVPKLIAAPVLTALAVPLIGYLLWGLNARYVADDFCYAVLVSDHGVVGAQVFWYNTFQGRLTSTFLMVTTSLADSHIVSILPLLILCGWLAACVWANAVVFRQVGWSVGVTTAVIFAGVIVVSVMMRATVFEDLMWRPGSITYTLPLVLGTVLAVPVIRGTFGGEYNGWGWAVVVGALAFVTGEFNESMTFLQVAALVELGALAFHLHKWKKRPAHFRLLIAALIGACAALAVTALAPGNRVRAALFGPPPGFVELAQMTAQFTGLYLWTFLNWSRESILLLPVPAILVLLIPLRNLPQWSGKDILKWGALGAVAVLLLVVASILPPAYGQHQLMGNRVRNLPGYVLTLMLVYASAVVGMHIRRLAPTRLADWRVRGILFVVLFGCLVIGPLRAGASILGRLPELQANAARWEERDAALRQAAARGEQNVTTYALPQQDEVVDLTGDPRYQANRCMARYYGLETLRATP